MCSWSWRCTQPSRTRRRSTTFVKSDATAAALFGVTGDLSSSAGWLNGNVFANFFPMVMLLLTIGYGAAAIAGQDEDGTLCLLVTLPRPRASIVTEKAAAMAVQAVVAAAVVAVCVMCGRAFELTTTVADIATTSAAVALMAIDFGLLALAIGGWRGRRGTAIGVKRGGRCRRRTWSARSPRSCRGFAPLAICRCSTGRSATTRSAAA